MMENGKSRRLRLLSAAVAGVGWLAAQKARAAVEPVVKTPDRAATLRLDLISASICPSTETGFTFTPTPPSGVPLLSFALAPAILRATASASIDLGGAIVLNAGNGQMSFLSPSAATAAAPARAIAPAAVPVGGFINRLTPDAAWSAGMMDVPAGGSIRNLLVFRGDSVAATIRAFATDLHVASFFTPAAIDATGMEAGTGGGMKSIARIAPLPLSAQRPDARRWHASADDPARLILGPISEWEPLNTDDDLIDSQLTVSVRPHAASRRHEKLVGSDQPTVNGSGADGSGAPVLGLFLNPVPGDMASYTVASYTVAARASVEIAPALGSLQWEARFPGALPEAIWHGGIDATTNDARLNLTGLFVRPYHFGRDTGSATTRTNVALDGPGMLPNFPNLLLVPDEAGGDDLRVDTSGGGNSGSSGNGGSGIAGIGNVGAGGAGGAGIGFIQPSIYGISAPIGGDNGPVSIGGLASATQMGFMQSAAPRVNRHTIPTNPSLVTGPLNASSPLRSASIPAPASARMASTSVGVGGGGGASQAVATLPVGIISYTVVDLHPILWSASQDARISNGQSGGFVQDASGLNVHAALWNGPGANIVDLHPASGRYGGSQIFDISGTQEVGIGNTRGVNHALLWSGASNVATDLNPTGYQSSYAMATTGSHQVGYGYTSIDAPAHALYWSGDANAVDLNPDGYIYTFAVGGSDSRQVGFGLTSTYALHAMIWAGSAASAIDLHPSSGAFTDSRAITLSGLQAAGFGTDAVSRYTHAILWSGISADAAVDLNPAGFLDSQVTAMSGSTEVGFGRVLGSIDGSTHALLWTGSAAGFTDLNAYLPAQYTSAQATGIDAAGNIVGFARDSITGQAHAVEWLAEVPEPVSFMPLATVGLFLARRRKR